MQNNISEARRSYALTLDSGKFSQEDAASMFGVSLSTYQKWEQGTGKLNGEILSTIADACDCSVEYLLCRTESPKFREVRVPSLAPDERELVDLYRNMNNAQRAAIMEMARSVVVGNEKNKAGNFADMERAGIVVS